METMAYSKHCTLKEPFDYYCEKIVFPHLSITIEVICSMHLLLRGSSQELHCKKIKRIINPSLQCTANCSLNAPIRKDKKT